MNRIENTKHDELKHFGILGMHWGIRRYQNPDGTLTPEGRERYGVKTVDELKKETYSQKLSTLQNKKDLTDKERETLRSLRNGKEYYEKWAGVYMDDPKIKEMYAQDNAKYYKDAQKWLQSTNYWKGSFQAVWLGGVIGEIIYDAKHYPKFEDEVLEVSGRKPLKNIMDFNTYSKKRRSEVQQIVEADLRSNSKFKKFMNKDYYEYDKDGKRVDYYSIIDNLTDKALEDSYNEFLSNYKKEHSLGYKKR